MKNPFIVLLVVVLFSGCALVEMKKENEALRQSIENKESRLDELERQNQLLYEKEHLLVKTLGSKKLNLDQIRNELDDLIKENKRLARLKNKRKKSVKETEQAIADMQNSKKRVAELEHSATVSEKEREIEALRKEIRQYLTIGLKAKYRPLNKKDGKQGEKRSQP